MCSNLLIVPSHLFGLPVFGFGLLLGLLLVVAGGWAAWKLRQPHGTEEVLAAVPVLGIVAGAIILLPRVFPEGFPVRGYGVMLIVAAVSGLAMAYARARQAGIDPDLIFSLALWMFVFGIAGGRLFYIMEYWDEVYAPLPIGQALIEVLKYANGGLVVYGALFGATLAFLLFMIRHHLPILAMADLVAPSLIVGLAFGRIGCLLNGCCFGGVADVPWAVTFPQQGQSSFSPPYGAQVAHGEFYGMRLVERNGEMVVGRVLADSPAEAAGLAVGDRVTHLADQALTGPFMAASLFEQALRGGYPLAVRIADKDEATLAAQTLPPRSLKVHPTQLYSAINAALLGWLLWSFYPARRRDGQVFALLITIYPVARFLLEMIRIDETSFLGTGLSISQNVSLLLLVAVGRYGFTWLASHVGVCSIPPTWCPKRHEPTQHGLRRRFR